MTEDPPGRPEAVEPAIDMAGVPVVIAPLPEVASGEEEAAREAAVAEGAEGAVALGHADVGAVGEARVEGVNDGGGELAEVGGCEGSGASANASPAEEEVRRRRQERLLDPNNSLNFHYRSFEQGHRLGGGGFGSVYSVRHRGTGALMAMKLVLLDQEMTLENFMAVALKAREEFSRIKQLQHPNIVLGFDCTYARIPGCVRSTFTKHA